MFAPLRALEIGSRLTAHYAWPDQQVITSQLGINRTSFTSVGKRISCGSRTAWLAPSLFANTVAGSDALQAGNPTRFRASRSNFYG
jgi:hypothetical protein